MRLTTTLTGFALAAGGAACPALGGDSALSGSAATEHSWAAPALSLASAAAADPISSGTQFYFRVGAWYTMLGASLAYGSTVNGAPVNLDLEDTLNYDTDVLTLRGQFGFHVEDRWHFEFGISGPFGYDGDTTQAFSFGDYTYSGNVHTEVDAVSFEGDFFYDVVHERDFRLGLGAGARAVLLHFEVQGTATDSGGNNAGFRDDDLDAGAILPVVGLNLRWDFSRNFYLAAKGMGIYVGHYGNAYDASAEIGWDFTRNIGIFAGYRISHLESDFDEIDDLDFEVDGTMQGPYAGLEVRF